jgi:hypothetical protein
MSSCALPPAPRRRVTSSPDSATTRRLDCTFTTRTADGAFARYYDGGADAASPWDASSRRIRLSPARPIRRVSTGMRTRSIVHSSIQIRVDTHTTTLRIPLIARILKRVIVILTHRQRLSPLQHPLQLPHLPQCQRLLLHRFLVQHR